MLLSLSIFLNIIVLTGCAGNKKEALDEMIQQTAASVQELGGSSKILGDESILPAGESSSDWIAMTLSFSGRKDAYVDYLSRLEHYVGKQYEEKGYLHKVKATEYHRISLTMLSMGGDPSKVQYGDREINLIADGTYAFAEGSPGLQGSNGLIYALLTLDSKKYEIPENTDWDREALVNELLGYQLEDGGFCIDQSLGSDVDITAMALQALAPYREQTKVKEAVEAGVFWLSEQATESGNFLCYGEENAESCAQVILALCALGIDPETYEMFQNKNILEALNTFRMEDGMYRHVRSGDADIMATYQSLLALEAVRKLRTEEKWIFDFCERNESNE